MNLEEQYHAEGMLRKIERVEAERDNAWTELREIRAAISANPEESTLDEVVKLRQQLADMTADRDRLLDVMCEIAGSKSLTATPTQFYQHLQRIASDATITNPEALESVPLYRAWEQNP